MDVVNTARSFWEKPEGKTGKVFAALGVLGGMWVLWKYGAAIKSSLFSFGVIINDVTNEPQVSMGMWWYHIFSYTK